MDNKGIVTKVSYKVAKEFLLPRHYSGRVPSISHAFGWYFDGELMAVCTFGKPASPYLCRGVCGEEHANKVLELNRLCRLEQLKTPLSYFVSYCLRELSKCNLIIVSYSDTEMNHTGYIYQACNFLYTGETKSRTDKYTEGNKHSRHYDKEQDNRLRKIRSPKHRYVFFAVKNKKTKKLLLESLNYPVEPYPKGANKTYKLGEFLQPKVIHGQELESI